jgi:formylglycine-generating enzyme required for sulfatase activity
MKIDKKYGNDEYGKYLAMIIDEIEIIFRYIEPGTFIMGSPEYEYSRFSDEKQRKVKIKKGFWLLDTPVTQELYEKVMGKNPSYFRGDPKLPVECVSWFDAKAFCKKFRELTDRKAKLPSEKEWEYACRAGTTTPFYTGETITTDQANFDGRYPYRPGDPVGVYRGKTTPVKMFPPNAWGLHGMHGNVWGWTRTRYGK